MTCPVDYRDVLSVLVDGGLPSLVTEREASELCASFGMVRSVGNRPDRLVFLTGVADSIARWLTHTPAPK